MNKKLTAKRLLKRHNRHASGGQNWATPLKLEAATASQVGARQVGARPLAKHLPKLSA